MMPIIKKYVRLLYKEDKEDMYSEFYLAILEALSKMGYIGQEGQCINYLAQAIRVKFLELYKKSRNYFDNETSTEEQLIYLTPHTVKEYNDVIFKQDIVKYLPRIKGRQKRILYSAIIGNQSIIEIAKQHQVSRQYVNKVRKNFYNYLKEQYFA